jgi:hypothetical protein
MLQVSLVISLFLALTVLVDNEFLYRISTAMPKMDTRHRFSIVFAVFGAPIAHSIEMDFLCSLLPASAGAGMGLSGRQFRRLVYRLPRFSCTTFTTPGLEI